MQEIPSVLICCLYKKVRNTHLITGVNPQKSMVSLALDLLNSAFFPTEKKYRKNNTPLPNITKPKRNYFVRSYFSMKTTMGK